MNKTLLIILCDFLLLSLLSLARFDSQPGFPEEVQRPLTGAAEPDLMEALQLALEEERQSREQLEEELTQAQVQALSATEALEERERRLQEYQQHLALSAEQAGRLESDRRQVEAQMKASADDLEALRRQLQSAARQTEVSQTRLQEMQRDLLQREREALLLQDQLARVEQRQQSITREKEDLALQLRLTEAERREAMEKLELERRERAFIQEHAQELAKGVTTLAEQTGGLRQELTERTGKIEAGVSDLAVQAGRIQENVGDLTERSTVLSKEVTTLAERSSQLGQGVAELQDRSTELTREIRDHRPLSGNVIFNNFLANRLDVDFRAGRSTFLGQRADARGTRTVLVRSGGNTYAVFHAQETLLNIAYGQTSWQNLWGSVGRDGRVVAAEEVRFLRSDPRVALVQVTAEQVTALGVEVFPLAEDPFRFGEAVLVGGGGDYFGEAPFQLDGDTPGYVRMERRRFSRLTGDFRPSRGDLVFSRSGEVLGIMVNREFCHVLTGLETPDRIPLGDSVQGPETREVLRALGTRVGFLPPRVQ